MGISYFQCRQLSPEIIYRQRPRQGLPVMTRTARGSERAACDQYPLPNHNYFVHVGIDFKCALQVGLYDFTVEGAYFMAHRNVKTCICMHSKLFTPNSCIYQSLDLSTICSSHRNVEIFLATCYSLAHSIVRLCDINTVTWNIFSHCKTLPSGFGCKWCRNEKDASMLTTVDDPTYNGISYCMLKYFELKTF
jgi:hypothetical protein